MPYISVHVDTDEVIDDIDTDELADALIRRKNWQAELQKACNKKGDAMPALVEDEIDLMLKDFYFGFPINDVLIRLCHERLGLFKPAN